MIQTLKRLNPNLLLGLTGLTFCFSRLSTTVAVVGTAAVMTGTDYVSILIAVLLLMVFLSALIAKLLVSLSFRIVGGIFTRRSGMLYPFPVRYGEFASTVLVFSCICFFLCGLVSLPLLFLPTLTNVLGAVRKLVIWAFLFLGARHFVTYYSHDYDKKALAVALSVIPFVLVGLTLAFGIWEVAA